MQFGFLEKILYICSKRTNSMINEEWRPVVGYEGSYEVSNTGKVYSLKSKKFLKCSPNSDGYPYTRLRKNGEDNSYFVHRLVMQAFVGECPDGCEVNHKDFCRTNNCVENLEYIPIPVNRSIKSDESRENIGKAARKNGIRYSSKPVEMVDEHGVVVAVFPSQKEASRVTGICNGNISNCCAGRHKTAGGYKWRYAS